MALYNELLDEFARFDAQLRSGAGLWGVSAGGGVAGRALFVIDRDGVIRWSCLSPIGVNPGAVGILKALEALPTKGLHRREQAGDTRFRRGGGGAAVGDRPIRDRGRDA